MVHTVAVIVAAGKGTRTGLSLPKQFELFAGKPVLRWSAEVLSQHSLIDRVIVVVSKGQENRAEECLKDLDNIAIIHGGRERAESVRNAIVHVSDSNVANILIHDAARPGVSPEIVTELIQALEECDGAAPALPMVDAIKTETPNGWNDVDRTPLRRVQTPQAFRFKVLAEANNNSKVDFVDDLSAVQDLGAKIQLINGYPKLSKLTYPADFKMLSPLFEKENMMKAPRIGMGFDVHAFEPGKEVVLCGTKIPHTAKLKGHSDADVAWHALADAIYGALAQGDIGVHFPPTDPQWKGAPSSVFLNHAGDLAQSMGYQIGNIDLTLICEQPKMKPHSEAMRGSTAELLTIAIEDISLKATTTETLGFTGRKEGIACQAIVMLIPNSSVSKD